MTQQLIIMRHAKSVQSGYASDHDRVLEQTGREQAPQSAEWIKTNQITPDLVLCSDARRTQQTWDLMQPVLGKVVIEFTPKLYLAESQAVLDLIKEVPDSVNTLMILGHNPTSSSLVEWLSGQFTELKTASCVLLENKDAGSWSGISEQKGKWLLTKQFKPAKI